MDVTRGEGVQELDKNVERGARRVFKLRTTGGSANVSAPRGG